MSYHGQPPPDYNTTGITVVNPLIRIERKLKRIEKILNNISDASALSASDLKAMIEKAIIEEDSR